MDYKFSPIFCLYEKLYPINPCRTRLYWLSPVASEYGTTLVKNNRLADKYLETLAESGKLVSRAVGDHEKIFEQVGLSAKYETTGNILVIIGSK